MKSKDKSIMDDSVFLKGEDIPSVRQLKQAALRLHKCASIYAKTTYSTKEGFSADDLSAVAEFLDFFISHIERLRTADKDSNTDAALEEHKKVRLCSVCKTGNINYDEETELILELAQEIYKERNIKPRMVTRKRNKE